MPDDVRWSITESDQPSGRDRQVLVARADMIRSFPPAPEHLAKAMISRLFLRFPQMAKATEEQVTSYARDIASFPMWAISKGLADIIAGNVLRSPEFPPSSLQVREAVEKAAEPVREELAAIEGLLTARVVSDEVARPDVARRREMAERARQEIRKAAGLPAMEPRKRDYRLPSKFDEAHSPKPADQPLTASPALLEAIGRGR